AGRRAGGPDEARRAGALRGRRVRLGEGARGRTAPGRSAGVGSLLAARPRALPDGAAPQVLRALRRAARPARAAQLRRHRARAEAERLPDEVPRSRPLLAAAREARGAAPYLPRGACRGGGRRARRGGAEAPPARPAEACCRPPLERARPPAPGRRADA